MSDRFSLAQKAVINRDARNMALQGIPLADELNAIWAAIDSGTIGITAVGEDVDSLALGGGHAVVDMDVTTGLTLAFKAFRFGNGMSTVTRNAGTVVLTASNTNYVECDRSATVTANTSGFTAGRLPLWIVTTGPSTIATIVSAKPLLQLIGTDGVTGTMLSQPGKVKELLINLGTVSATTSVKICGPGIAAVLAAVRLVVDTTVAQSDTDYWQFSAVNKGPAGTGSTAMLDTGTVNSTKTTGGSGLTAYVARGLTLHATPANLVTAANDVVVVTFTKAASAADLVNAQLRLDFSFTN
jgi:hypothetical protein